MKKLNESRSKDNMRADQKNSQKLSTNKHSIKASVKQSIKKVSYKLTYYHLNDIMFKIGQYVIEGGMCVQHVRQN